MSTALQDGFMWVPTQPQTLAQKNLGGQTLAGEGGGVVTQQHQVIYMAQVGAHFEGMLNELV